MRIAILIAAATLAACGSPSEPAPADAGATATAACTCGEAETAFHGCAHALCVSGQGNPENPDCVCGPLSIEE